MSLLTTIESFVKDIPKFEFKKIENGNALYYALTFNF